MDVSQIAFMMPYPRHPSQLYEAFMEGAVLFTLLWIDVF